jgi:hypothetical protein
MRYILLERVHYFVIIDTERDQLVLLTRDLVLCRKILELCNGKS